MDKRPDRYQKNIRLKDYDYSSAGYYFVTIVSYMRKNIFGEIIDGEIELNPLGMIVEKTWQEIPQHFPYIEVDSHVVMPNHFHGIVIINEVGRLSQKQEGIFQSPTLGVFLHEKLGQRPTNRPIFKGFPPLFTVPKAKR